MARSIGAFHLSGNMSDNDEIMTLDKQTMHIPQSLSFLMRSVPIVILSICTALTDILFYYISIKL